MPRQQFVDPIDRALGDTLDDIAQVSLWIQVIELGRANQAVDGRGALATRIGATEQIILSVMRIFALQKLCEQPNYAEYRGRQRFLIGRPTVVWFDDRRS